MAESTITPNQGADNHNQEKTELYLPVNTHRPLHSTKSSPTFRSTQYLEVQKEEVEGRRSRSSSAPLSAEAVTVARELRKASDNYVEAKRGVRIKRRRTLGSILSPSIEKEVAQAIKECDEYPDCPSEEGTPV